jgi:hypothetical protein
MYLLIWGEAANLRFMPECLCYIFHYMALDLNHVIDQSIDVETGRPSIPAVHGEDAFLEKVVTPIYNVLKAEVEFSRNGTKPHSAWRNYEFSSGSSGPYLRRGVSLYSQEMLGVLARLVLLSRGHSGMFTVALIGYG